MPQSRPVQSVVRAIRLLETLAREGAPMGVTEIAGSLGLKTPTAHNLLRTLAGLGYAARLEGGRYRLGYACGRLGSAYAEALHVPAVAQPIIDRLAADLNESVLAAMMEQGEAVVVARASANRTLQVRFPPVVVRDAYAYAVGRVLLAYQAEDELSAFITTHPPAQSAAEDIRTAGDVRRILERVRVSGHAAFRREEGTVLAVAAPVRNEKGGVVAAVGVSVPAVRLSSGRTDHILKSVKKAARGISDALGAPAA